jgi:hypothetical protein
MKILKTLTYFLLSATALLNMGCEKTALKIPADAVPTGARIKLVHAAPDIPGVDLYVGNTKISGFTPANATLTDPGTPVPIAYNNAFPGSGSGYAVIPAGQSELKLSAPASASTTSATVVYSQTQTLEDNKYYSMFLIGTKAQPEVLFLNDEFSQVIDPNKYYVRIINLTPNNYDLVLTSTTTATVLAPNLPYKGVSSFIPVDIASGASFAFRTPGSSTNVTTPVTFTNPNGLASRVLTVVVRGVPGQTGTFAPALSTYLNR